MASGEFVASAFSLRCSGLLFLILHVELGMSRALVLVVRWLILMGRMFILVADSWYSACRRVLISLVATSPRFFHFLRAPTARRQEVSVPLRRAYLRCPLQDAGPPAATAVQAKLAPSRSANFEVASSAQSSIDPRPKRVFEVAMGRKNKMKYGGLYALWRRSTFHANFCSNLWLELNCFVLMDLMVEGCKDDH